MSKSGKWGMIVGGSLAVLTAAHFAWANRRLLLVNSVTTGENIAYPKLRSRVYYADVDRVLTAAEQALRRLPRWKLVLKDIENDTIEAEARSPLALFTSDVTLYAISLGHGQTRVILHSRSRMRGGDWGWNAAHIRQMQHAMDDRLNTDAAF